MSELDARQAANDDLDGKSKGRLPAWKLREQMKKASHPTSHMRKPVSARPKLDDDLDPNLPPAFREMAKAQRRKKAELDDFNSLDSVHSSKSYRSITQTPTTKNDSDSFDDDSSDCSFDGHDSFASLGEDDDDDEAIREGKNLLAKQQLEDNARKTNVRSRLKKAGLGTLDLIAE